MSCEEQLQAVTFSREQLSELIKQKLYSLGFARLEGQYISHVDFGSLQDDETIPIHFWISSDDRRDEHLIFSGGINASAV